jgi:hypothetical protein
MIELYEWFAGMCVELSEKLRDDERQLRLDLGVLAYRLLELYEWFADMCVELQDKLRDDAVGQ